VGYPATDKDPFGKNISYAIPVFLKIPFFRNDMRLMYFLGIGLQAEQIGNLIVDFIALYLISIYLFFYGHPLLNTSMKKVYWSFPKTYDSFLEWDQLSDDVR
jgi:hypothetical protein